MAGNIDGGRALPSGPNPASVAVSPGYLVYVIGLLALVNAVNLMDRLVISVMMPAIKAELHLSDTQLGLLSGLAFAVLYATVGIPLAAFADRSVRRNIVAGALVLWSAMTACCGLAQNFLQLALARMAVGVGEAGCLPPSHSMISDYFPRERRSRALAIMAAGGTVGSVTGLMLGGWLVGTIGWRNTYFVMGLPGVLLGLIVYLTLKEPLRGRYDAAAAAAGGGSEPATIMGLIRQRPAYFQLVLAVGTSTFVGYGLLQWLPTFYMRSYGLSIAQIGIMYGAVQGASSLFGTVAGGVLGDRLHRRGLMAILYYGMACNALTFVFKLGVLLAPTAASSLAFNFLSGFVNAAFLGPAFALVQTIAPPRLRAQAAAVLTFFVSLVGTGAGPLFVGVVSDAYAAAGAGVESLRYGMLWCSILALWPVLHLWLARRTIERDVPALGNIRP